MKELPAAGAAVLLVLAVVGVLQLVAPAAPSVGMDSLREIEPRSAHARAACATMVIDQLVDAFNAGDAERLAGLLDDAATADRLLARHAAGERWLVERVDADAGPSWHGAIDVTLVLTREAPDLPDGRVTATGTGVLSCVSGRIASLRLEPA